MAQQKALIPPEVKEDPVAFARHFCHNRDGSPAMPHPGQEQLLRGMSHYTIVAAGRQWGKSVCIAWYILWYLVTHRNREVLIIAPTLDQAKVIFNQVSRHMTKGVLGALVAGKIKHSPFPEFGLVNGSSCHARGASSPEYIRGRSPHLVVIDEAAFIKDGKIREIEPLMTVTGKEPDSGILMISTPFGRGEFYDFFMDAQDEAGSYMRRFHFTSLDNPYADMRFLESVRTRYGEDSLLWRTEYLAEFVDDDLSVFPWKDIKWAVDAYPYDAFPVAAALGHSYVMGVDLANTRDYFVASVLDTTNPALCPLVTMTRTQRRGWAWYKGHIRELFAAYNHAKPHIDATTLAESVVEDLADIGASGYKFTGSTAKYDAVQELVRMLSEHRLALPNDRDIINELRFFSYDITPSKKLRMEARQGHDDIVMSLALASILATQRSTRGFFLPVAFTQFGAGAGVKERPRAKGTQETPDDPFARIFKEGWE